MHAKEVIIMKPIYPNIIWDWNGTLLDDVGAALDAVNEMLIQRGQPAIDRARYCECMEMPIIRFYEKVFDLTKEPFESLVKEYNKGYGRQMMRRGLMLGAKEVLQALSDAGAKQYIISASERATVEEYAEKYGIRHYFAAVLGAKDQYSVSKIGIAAQYLKEHAVDPAETVVIGDILHDFEMAEKLGTACLLIANGHQSREDLLRTGAPVLDSIFQVPDKVLCIA